MKSIKKPSIKKTSGSDVNTTSPCKSAVKLHMVSEKERELYRVPSYGYLIP